MANYLTPGSFIGMTESAADRLYRADSGDAALLYLQMLRAKPVTDWDPARYQAALAVLQENGLAPESTSIPQPAPVPELTLPEYPQETIDAALADTSSNFSGLCELVEHTMNRPLADHEYRELYRLYDYMNLSVEYIFLAVTWFAEEAERNRGPGSRPRLFFVRREICHWVAQGITTYDQLEAHIRRLTCLRNRESEVQKLLGLDPRPLPQNVKQYIANWDEMGFRDEAIQEAYERTMSRVRKLNWDYMNGILRQWHESGLHTMEAILAVDADHSKHDAPPPSASSASAADAYTDTIREDMERIRQMLEEWKENP